MSTVTFCSNMSLLTKLSLECFTGLESNLRAETEETRLLALDEAVT